MRSIQLLNKYFLVVVGIVLLGQFLILYRLGELMLFIGDQGWYFISARDILKEGELPLIGITSSHVWLHQGSLWSYILAPILPLVNYHPVYASMVTSFIGVSAIVAVYLLSKELFSERVASIAALLYATSPIVIIYARMSYHTSPISLLTLLLIYSVFKWVKGNVIYFPIALLLTALLYSFELATFTLVPAMVLILGYGLYKRKSYALRLINKRIIAFSILAISVPIIPMIIYDLGHGFPQTLRFIIWVFYKVAVFFGYPPVNPGAQGETWQTFFPYFVTLVQRTVFIKSALISFALIGLSLFILVRKLVQDYRANTNSVSHVLLFLYFSLPALGYIVARTNSEAYGLTLFPTTAILIALLFDHLLKRKISLIPAMVSILLIAFLNTHTLISTNYLMGNYGYGLTFEQRINAARSIVSDANGRKYNLVGTGDWSQYYSFLSSHEYLTWWLGNPPSKDKQNLQFYIREYPDRIEIRKKE